MRATTTAVIIGCILCAAGPAAAQADLSEAIDKAVEHGIEQVWSRQKPNGMSSGASPTTRTKDYYYYGDWEVVSMTSLAYGGAAPEDPRIKTALKTLLELELDRTYTIGFRMIALAEFYRNAKDATRPGLRAALKRDVDALLSYQHDDGSWHYHGESRSQWDFSNTQIALLALKEAVACGVEVDAAVFQKALKLYLEKQRPDGGWNYGNPTKPAGTGGSYVSMTAAGTASLFILRDLLNPGQGCPCRGGHSAGRRNARVDQGIDRGLAWLADHLPADGRAVTDSKKCNYYQLYACERVGINSGLKYLGTHDWYAEGVRQILPLQRADGSWPGKCGDTMFALLFLIKGRGPILVNKLMYDGDWDLHSRDAAGLAGYVGRIKEQRINWQVIHLDIPVEAMHDSPILYITAEKAFDLSDEHRRKLREFTDTGGTVLLEASCGNRAAAAWWPRLCRELWPEWELATVDKEHPLWQADLRMTKLVPGLMGISDGLRTFVFYSPRDISCKWHAQSITRDEELFKFGSNLYAYATDRGKLRGRLAAREVGAGKKYAADKPALAGGRALKIARFAHGGRWHLNRRYHPWELLAADLKERTGLDLSKGDPVEPGKDIPADVGLLYLTGREALGLDDAARARLKAYLASGGFLFAEATLGDEAFDKTVREMLSAMKLTLKPAEANDPLLAGAMPGGGTGYKVCDADYTFALRPSRVGKTQPLLFRIESGGTLVGVYSPFDIMYSQTGCTAFDSRGYAAADARALASNVALLAAGRPPGAD